MAAPESPGRTQRIIDHSAPFKDIVVCCTSIPTEGRTIIAQRVTELGGTHKYDLTPDVTHLIVGDYDTPKYRHVARERPDIKAMDARWIVAISDLWRNGDDDFNFDALETKHQLRPFDRCGSMPTAISGDGSDRQGLLISLTGFGDARDGISEKIIANGATYTPDLTKQCTHLIVHQPEGKKFAAAKQWGVHTVSLQWLEQSIERGLILEENKFDPTLPFEEQGLGAWTNKDPRKSFTGKRSRSGTSGPEEGKGPRKLRKTASMKLNSQRNGLWGDILKRSDSKENSITEDRTETMQHVKEAATAVPDPSMEAQRTTLLPVQGTFGTALFCIHGFKEQRAQILDQTITSMGGTTVQSLEALTRNTQDSRFSYRLLIVPQSSQPDTHPQLPSDHIHIITEFYIEKCLHNKQFFDPREHVIGRPFPAFPIAGLKTMTICTAAFTGIELSQVARSVTQLGATFAEEFRPSASVLVCRTLAATRKEKLKCALAWGIPVVSAEWLWECISTGCAVPIKDFTFNKLKKRRSLGGNDLPRQDAHDEAGQTNEESASVPSLPPTAPADMPKHETTFRSVKRADRDGFDASDIPAQSKGEEAKNSKAPYRPAKHDSTTSADFQTARTTLVPTRDSDSTLTERSSASLNKSPSPSKRNTNSGLRTKSDPTPLHNENSVAARAPSAPPTEKAPVAQDEETEQDSTHNAAEQQHHALLTSRLNTLVDTGAAASFNSAHSMEDLKPRRRQLLGRATSNASATSSIANPPAAPASDAGVFGADDNDDDGGAVRVEGQGGQASQEHPSTQLVYGDPEAQGVKARIMSRMAGEDVPVKVKSAAGQPVTAGRTLRKRA
ncbi:hypothetical protein LIA77_00283 [Sarocladium implicatum]|nr:hypothetical protein LIA77_00283 [Sarocladium implicatum]